MKTIAFNRSRGSLFTTIFVLGALGALYYFRRNGGKVSDMVTGVTSGVSGARGMLTSALDKVGAGDAMSTGGRYGRGDEISTSPEQMDRIPTT